MPVDSGFNESHVPDQVSDRHGAGLDWRGGRWGFGYRLDYSPVQADIDVVLRGSTRSWRSASSSRAVRPAPKLLSCTMPQPSSR